ncbi:MAG: DNA mismatch repair endonuclease MutL [Planctomycetales bacterium]|nr:DNA mismatch repair endonuclease MutL [Planctomycetales bacterium]
MPTIRQLPPSLVNKIAAGEVIERPASVVKELLENSIDAGATAIELAIEAGGIDLIRISDNGCGIDAAELPLAVASHATSKLQSADDLFDVHTLGFRGEALASIAEISHLTLKTRTAGSEEGAELTVRGGERAAIVPAGCPVGTIIEVRNLFFNTPVRRKFMRTPQTEASHITEAFTRIALAFPEVAFTFRSGNRVVQELPVTDSWKERIRAFFGAEVGDSLMAVESMQEEGELTGYVADPSVSRSNNRMQYIFLNGRHIRDRSLQHALGEAYRGLLMVGRFPVCFLRLKIPAEQVDVNVHPTKMEVRFQAAGKIYSQLLQTLRHQFLTTDLTARVRHVPGPVASGLRPENQTLVSPPAGNSLSDDRWEAHADQMSAIPRASKNPELNLTGMTPEFCPFPDSSLQPQSRLPQTAPSARTGLPVDAEPSGQPIQAEEPTSEQTNNSDETSSPLVNSGETERQRHLRVDQEHRVDGTRPEANIHSHLGFQVHNRYLITQDEDGMVVVDQHALHERILYEQLRQKTESRALESQQLLVPEPLDLTPTEAAAALEFRDVLKQIGIAIEPFGGDTILMTSYPAMLANMRPADVLRQVLEPLMSGGNAPDVRELLDELLHMLACKAAIKAGDKLSPEEITALLEQRYHYQDTHHCPHGRPTALFFSRAQLDKMFKRT